jgi:hypothetical protein
MWSKFATCGVQLAGLWRGTNHGPRSADGWETGSSTHLRRPSGTLLRRYGPVLQYLRLEVDREDGWVRFRPVACEGSHREPTATPPSESTFRVGHRLASTVSRRWPSRARCGHRRRATQTEVVIPLGGMGDKTDVDGNATGTPAL